jgi:hypothetical protein
MEGADRLVSGGFVRCGSFQLAGNEPTFVGKAPTQPGVYAFTVRSEVVYIGAAQDGVQNRMASYIRHQARRSLSRPIHKLMTQAIQDVGQVEVLAIIPEPIRWHDMPVDTIAGLEAGLIRELRPQWNRRGLGERRVAPIITAEQRFP